MSKLKYKYKAANEDGDLKHSFSKYVVKGNFCDVTLVSDDYQHFPAHKLMLAAHSPVLKTLLLNCPQLETSHAVLHVRGFSGQQLQHLLHLVYAGELVIDDAQVNDFNLLTSELKIKIYEYPGMLCNSTKEKSSSKINRHRLKEEGFADIPAEANVVEEQGVKELEIESEQRVEYYEQGVKTEQEIENGQAIENEHEKEIGQEIENEHQIENVIKDHHLNNITLAPVRDSECENEMDSIGPSSNQKAKEDEENIILEYVNPDFKNSVISKVDNAKSYFKIIAIDNDSDYPKPFECPMCDNDFPKRRLLLQHFNRKHAQESEFTCKICSKKLNAKDAIVQHFSNIHGAKRYQCSICDYKSGSITYVQGHYRRHHTSRPTFQCDECNHVVREKYELKQHKKINHGFDGGLKMVKCNKCNAMLKENSLNSHMKYFCMKMTHELKRFPCSKCPLQASSKEYLRKHVASKHDGERYPCKSCDYVGSFELSLKNHMQTEHSGLRFYCDECAAVFRSKCQLKKHMKIKHNSLIETRAHNAPKTLVTPRLPCHRYKTKQVGQSLTSCPQGLGKSS